jgi:NADPH:quinone reductase-like Zn-dependent oxidoreductase
MRAASLNFRDLLVPLGRYFGGPVPIDLIALSDGAGEVVALGSGVSRFKVGDRICGTFFRNYVDGPPAAVDRPALGSPVDGVLAEYVVFNERDAVHMPANNRTLILKKSLRKVHPHLDRWMILPPLPYASNYFSNL